MGEILKNIVRLSSGHIVAHTINLLVIPIITRIYSPGQYGVFAIYSSLVMLLSAIAPLKMNYALMLPRQRNYAINLLALSIISISIVSLIVCIVSIILHYLRCMPSDWIKKGFEDYLLLVPVGCFLIACAQTFRMWSLRNKQYNIMPISRIAATVGDRSLVLSLGYYTSLGATGLVLGRIVGPLVTSSIIVCRVIMPEIKKIISSINYQTIIRMANRYREYHLLSTLSLFLSKASREIPILLIGVLFDLEIAAYYAFTMRIINLPITLIGDAISNVFFQKTTEIKQSKNNFLQITEKLFNSMFYIACPIVVLTYFYGDVVISAVFGREWTEVGTYTKILIFAFLGQFIYKPVSVLYDTLELQRAKLIFDNIILILRISAILIGALVYNSIVIALCILTISSLIVYLCSIMYIFKRIGKNILKFTVGIFHLFIIVVPFILGVFLIRLYFGELNLIGSALILLLIVVQSLALWNIRYAKIKEKRGG